MKKYHLVTLLLLPLFSIAQSNYKSGYVINTKGDTLRGYIDLKEWSHNPKNVSFKPSLNDKARQMGLSDINYFEATGFASYREFNVSLSLNPIDLASPPSLADTSTSTDNVFLKILQSGKNVVLYSYTDGVKQRLYIKESGMATPVELLYGVYQGPNGSDKVVIKNTYQLQLEQLAIKYLPADDKLITRIQQADYVEDYLQDIVAKINGNTSAGQSSNIRTDRTAVRFFAGISLISNTIKDGEFNSTIQGGLGYGTPSATSKTPKVSAGADLIINPAVGHLTFRLELAYSSNNYSYNILAEPDYNSNGTPNLLLIKATQKVISALPQVIFNIYNANTFKIFADVGYGLNFVSYSGDEHLYYYAKSYYTSFQFKGGIAIAKRLEIYGIYFPGADLSNTFDFTKIMNSYQFGVNYYFGKGAR